MERLLIPEIETSRGDTARAADGERGRGPAAVGSGPLAEAS